MQRVWAGIFLGHQTVVKQRFSKKYRNPVLDFRLNTTRLKQVGLPAAASSKTVSCPQGKLSVIATYIRICMGFWV